MAGSTNNRLLIDSLLYSGGLGATAVAAYCETDFSRSASSRNDEIQLDTTNLGILEWKPAARLTGLPTY